MRKILLTALLLSGGLTASAQYLPNGGFEEWKTECGKSDQTSYNDDKSKPVGLTTRPGIEPQYWNGSNVNQSVVGQNASNGELVTKVIEGSNTYVKLLNCKVGVHLGIIFIGDPAPAFINFATPWVYAVTTKSKCDGGVYGGTSFTYKPDAIKGRYKRSEPESKEKAHIIAYLWNGTFTSQIPDNTVSGGKRSQKDVDRAIMGIDKTNVTGDGKLIASCDYTFTSTKDNDWEEIVVPINYALTDEVPTKMNVIISSADYWTRSNIKEGSALDVDDVQFVYYHALKSFTYDGVTTAITDGKYDYTIDQVYDKDKFSCEKIGVGATVEKEFDYDNNILTVTVKGNDFDKNEESKTVYTFKFKGVSFTSDLSVEINGEVPEEPAPNTIQLIKEADDSYTFQLKNFSLGDMHVGTITLKNLDVNGEKITSSQTIQIEEGDDPTVDSWVGPYLPEVPVNLDATRQGDDLTADINIDMTETLDMVIRVVFAPTVEINGTTDLTQISAGLKNIHFTRSFKAGWNTICVPFNFTTSEYVTSTLADDDEEEDEILMAFDEYRDGKIYFKEVEEIEANVPYLIYYPTEVKDNDIYFGAEVFEPEPRAICSNGFCFQGNYTPSFAMRGRYGVADMGAEGQYILLGGEGSTLPATACFFTSSVGKPQSVMLVVNGGETTGIEGIETSNTNDAAVYDLKGIRVSNGSINGLPKGLYIKGGKKVYVK